MKDFVDGTAFNNEQGNRARKLFAAVVLAALDDAIADDKKYGNGPEQIARWAHPCPLLRAYRQEPESQAQHSQQHGTCHTYTHPHSPHTDLLPALISLITHTLYGRNMAESIPLRARLQRHERKEVGFN